MLPEALTVPAGEPFTLKTLEVGVVEFQSLYAEEAEVLSSLK